MLFRIFLYKIFVYLLSMIYLCIIIDNFISMQVSKIKRVKSYIETLRGFDVGDTKYYELVDTDYTGFHNARKRLQDKKVGQFSFKQYEENGKKYFMITRNA